MAIEKHYNEEGVLPDALEDHKPTDRRAAWSLVYVLLGTAVLVGLVMLLMKVF